MKLKFKLPIEHKGGPGSGNHGHAGRPGQVGGSAAGGGAKLDPDSDEFYDAVNAKAEPMFNYIKRNAVRLAKAKDKVGDSLDVSGTEFDDIFEEGFNKFRSEDDDEFNEALQEIVGARLEEELYDLPGFSY